MNGCIYRTQSDLCKLYTKDDTISFCEGEDCPDRKQSNADRIRSMTDEELAVMIALPYLASPPWCSEHRTCPYISDDPTPCDKCALDWLKEEAEGRE